MFNYLTASGIDKFTFYRVPKILFTDAKFQHLTSEAKILYGLLLDRATLSKTNHWIDEDGRVYVYYKQDEAMELLNIKKNKVISIFRELEEIGLIVRKKIGQGNPTKIYVMNFSEPDGNIECISQTSDETIEKDVKRFEKQTSENCSGQTSDKNIKKDVKRFEKQTSKGLKNKINSSNYINNTELNDTESIYQSADVTNKTSENLRKNRMNDKNDYPVLVNRLKEQISYDMLITQGKEQSTLDLIVSLIADIYSHSCEKITVNGIDMPIDRVEEQFKKLEYEHIDFIFECLEQVTANKKIKNIRSYLLTCLYNAPYTMGITIDSQVNFDMHNGFHQEE